MRPSEEPLTTYFVHVCAACGEQLDLEAARGRDDIEVMGPFAPRHRHDAPDGGPPVWVGARVMQLVDRNEFVRVKGEKDLLLANEASLRSRTERAELRASMLNLRVRRAEFAVSQGVRGALRRWLKAKGVL